MLAHNSRIVGGYALDLYCECGETAHVGDFNIETFADAAKRARKWGWIVNRKANVAKCPKCNPKWKESTE